jgi:hypothetical protein
MDLETAARGYATRLDTSNPTKGFKRQLDKVENQMSDLSKLTYVILSLTQTHGLRIAGRTVKMAKTSMSTFPSPSNTRELKRLADTGPAPAWFTKVHEIWEKAMVNVNLQDLVSAEKTRCFPLPPIHLFWGECADRCWET